MKISAAQTKPIKGDIQANIANHVKLASLAAENGAGLVVFPELSITGYEPDLAAQLATEVSDKRFDVFQQISNDKNIIICIGMPTKANAGVLITMIIFQPNKPRETYSKQYLHSDELPYFINGNKQFILNTGGHTIAPAICYELSVDAHQQAALNCGADVYLVSVANSVTGVEKALVTLQETASKYSMTALFSNCVGHCDNFDCGGKSSAWNDKGVLLGQMDGVSEGLIILDVGTGEVVQIIV